MTLTPRAPKPAFVPSAPPQDGSHWNTSSYHHPHSDLTTSDPLAEGEHCAPALRSPVLYMTWHVPGLMKSSSNQSISCQKRETICSWPKNFCCWLCTAGYSWASGLSVKSKREFQESCSLFLPCLLCYQLSHRPKAENNASVYPPAEQNQLTHKVPWKPWMFI